MPQMVWTATPDGVIDYYNQRWSEYTGVNFHHNKDWDWKRAVHHSDEGALKDLWTRALVLGVTFEAECRLHCASSNTYRWHLSRALPVRDAHGAVVRWFGSCTDIEEQKRAETEIKILNDGLEERVRQRVAELDRTVEQLAKANEELKASSLRLERSNHELQAFTSVASHDLQEPLRKVQTFGNRLRTVSREAMGEQGRDYLDRMLNATKRMNSLIQDLLSFARVTSEAHAFLPVDLAKVTREVLSDLEVLIDETNALIEVGDLPTIDGHAGQIRQLLQNLIGNALKFRQPGCPPAVKIYTQEDVARPVAERMFQLIVEDKGIGFDEKYLDRIFTVFQRLHARTEYEGTGVGLAICRKIAQWHGGDITAKSSPGNGASFRVALPFRHANVN
jgi:light-regulated signal transduction histidine kinase (bacteriophytochrome)